MAGRSTVTLMGVGRMGAAIAGTLHRNGFDLVVWNRDEAKAEALAEQLGATTASSPAEAAAQAKIILTSLADDEALRSVYLRPGGVVAGITPGSVAIDTSTVDPETSMEVGRAVGAAGARFLESPVSGSVSTVEAGALTIMVAGDAEVLDEVRPVLEALSARIVFTGTPGSATATKLAVNALVHGLNVALSEALVLAEKAGVDRATAYDVFASGAGGAPFVQYKRDSFEHPETAPVAFSIDLVAKDYELIAGLGRRVGAPLDQVEASRSIVRRAIEAGMGAADLSAIAVYLRGEET